MRNSVLLLINIFAAITLTAQIISIDPQFPTRDEEVTITYDATLGSAGLVDVDQVYMHTGLITNTSSGPSDWMFVVGSWGTDDVKVKMTNIGNNLHQLTYIINEFYNVPNNVEIEKLAFVFRSVDGSQEGKTETGGDIFLDFNNSDDYATQLISPSKNTLIAEVNDVINIKFSASEESMISIKDNGSVIYEETASTIDYDYTVTTAETHLIEISSTFDGETKISSFNIVVNPEVTIAALPQGSKLGINKLSSTDYRLVLLAPGKSNVYVLGDFTDWKINTDYFMKRSPDGRHFWAEIDGLDEDKNYAFQYLIDGEIQVADPFSELVLDPNNDQWISESTFPNMHPYPNENATGYVSLLKTMSEDFDFQYEFTAPEKEDLVIYELLMRDFTQEANYETLLDTLDYLDGMGINAIEFMPINEFEGNLSWGYNPSFHMALDKYYGTPEAFKTVVDECHKRGIAVILDVVYNHAFSQSPLAQMYWDASNFRPSSDNPFLNTVPKHPFNVGSDFNHESPATRAFVKRVTQYWLEEYNIDGFRFDLSKGFTQKQSSNDAVFRAYDQERIDVLKLYADDIWEVNQDAYVILEHFGANDEEEELSDYGMMLWSNHNFNYNEATMGYNTGSKSNFEWIDYKKKGWANPHAVGFMESHDEERLMYKNLEFGNNNGDYNVKDLNTALKRVQMATSFFYTMPGPKMLWQFGEMGYDFSINRCEDGSISEDCRLSPKPIRWDYRENIQRKRLVEITSALITLKTTTNITNTSDYNHDVKGAEKYIKLFSDDANALIVGNFDVTEQTMNPGFIHTGTWYDYLSDNTIEVTSNDQDIVLAPGEYHIYLDKDIESGVLSSVEDPKSLVKDFILYPNPTSDQINLEVNLVKSSDIRLTIYDQTGRIVHSRHHDLKAGKNLISENIVNLNKGIYHIALEGSEFSIIDRFIVVN